MLVSIVKRHVLWPERVRAWFSFLWYEAVYWLTMGGLTLAFSLRFEGRRHIPRHGPALLIANHQSFLDPIAIGLAMPRHICFLARKTLFRNSLFGNLLRSLNAAPVDQEGVAKEGLKTVLEQLRNGHAVLIFPEGERSWKGNVQDLKPGISLLVRRAGVPIIPIGIAGAYEALPRTRNWPAISPLFLPAMKGTIAVSVMPPLDSRHLAHLERGDLLTELHNELQKAYQRAERLRRKR